VRGDRVEAATEAAEQGAARAEVRRGAGRENPEEEAAGPTVAVEAAEVRAEGVAVPAAIRGSARGSDYKATLILPTTEFEHAPHP
jgi:hypothetical protein